jgi:putative nucleotidyltransferase with HDIG domain
MPNLYLGRQVAVSARSAPGRRNPRFGGKILQGRSRIAAIRQPARAMENERQTQLSTILLAIGVTAVVAAAVWQAPNANWDWALFGTLLSFSAFSDILSIETESRLKVSGSFLALVIAIVFLGGTPAALIGIFAILVGWLRFRESLPDLLVNALTFMAAPLLLGVAFHEVISHAGITTADPVFYVLVFGTFACGIALNFLMVGAYTCYLERSPLIAKAREVIIPLLPSELAAALMAVGVAFLYAQIGLAGVAFFGIVLVTFQYLLGALIKSQERARELEVRTNQLASFQVGMLSALLRTLDLRDQMTARHSAAVARYSRAIAQKAGFSKREEELVHIAALLHDIGKFILPDRILKANVPLTDEDWMLIRRHPQQGARVVSSLDGYGPVADIILAHHERIDGKGYPRGLEGDDIPELARIISVADTYDVMTARDSYRTPTSSYEAIQELRRVAGKQLDARFVEVFIGLIEDKDVSFRHGEEADFERELSLEARIAETASPGADSGRFQVAGVSVG